MRYKKQKLLFVYNAESGYFAKLTDMVHKIVSPGTYACSLCAITYGKFTMHAEWAAYLRDLPLEVEFIYKNDWKHASICAAYPLVALQTNDRQTEVLLHAQELNQIKSLAELKSKLEEAMGKASC